MFKLSKEEFGNLKSQFVISSWGGVGRSTPYAFSEQGVAMLSSVLRSERAVQVNIKIMRTFVRLRQMVGGSLDLRRKIEAMEQKYDSQFKIVFEAIRRLMAAEEAPPKRIGFVKEKRALYPARPGKKRRQRVN